MPSYSYLRIMVYYREVVVLIYVTIVSVKVNSHCHYCNRDAYEGILNYSQLTSDLRCAQELL